MAMKNWKEAYPLNTLRGESRKEFERFIEGLLEERAREVIRDDKE